MVQCTIITSEVTGIYYYTVIILPSLVFIYGYFRNACYYLTFIRLGYFVCNVSQHITQKNLRSTGMFKKAHTFFFYHLAFLIFFNQLSG